jgi:DNA-binding response OmpR family regulator
VRFLGHADGNCLAPLMACCHGLSCERRARDRLITDVQMPGLSGVELQSRLIAQGNRMPTIFVTASTEEKTRARALKAGAIGFLTKPFNVDRLIEYIHMALADRKIGTVESLALGLAAPFGPARATAEGILGRAAPSPLSAEKPAT